MPEFTAVYGRFMPEPAESLSFKADSVSEALSFLARRYPLRAVDLWCGEAFLGHLKHIIEDDASFWQLG